MEEFGILSSNQFARFSNESQTFRRRNLNGLHLNAAMVVTNNDTLAHLNDYK